VKRYKAVVVIVQAYMAGFDAGFHGIYLDIIDAFEYFKE
jgi:endo-alpha-1,4-polygalactosaminidase (GH114 family)